MLLSRRLTLKRYVEDLVLWRFAVLLGFREDPSTYSLGWVSSMSGGLLATPSVLSPLALHALFIQFPRGQSLMAETLVQIDSMVVHWLWVRILGASVTVKALLHLLSKAI